MDEKISLSALDDYSDDFASKVTASFFSSKEKITGPEILKACDIQQINLFVIRELLHAWRLESHKLRSPFFDYAHPTVAEALSKFQNLLSNHISISRENFQPLLKKAVSQTLFLILHPYDFYSDILDKGTAGILKVEELKNEIKFVKINRIPLERLLQILDEKKLVTISGNEAFGLLDHILEEVNFAPEEIDTYVARFSEIAPLSLDRFYDKKPTTPEKPVDVRTEPVREIPVVKTMPVVKEEAKSEPVREKPTKAENVRKAVPAQATLYDQLAKNAPATTLAEDFQKKKKIKDSLTINQKFMFTKILFNGDFEIFSNAIDKIDELDNLDQAKSYLANNYAEWNKESEEYEEFMEMVEKRFA